MKLIKKTWTFLDGLKRIIGIFMFSAGGLLYMANEIGWLIEYSNCAKMLMTLGAILGNIGSVFALRKRNGGK